MIKFLTHRVGQVLFSSTFALAVIIQPGLVRVARAQYVGVTCGFQYSSQLTGPLTYPNQQNISLYNPDPSNPNLTWDSWVEQLAQAGVDFVCPNLTGSQPNANGTPTKIAPMVSAVNARGLAGQIKFAIFDDNASSWTAQWNMANGRGYGYAQPFDMNDSNNWRYIYDWNYKLFYQNVPDANRFKINGRPIITIWSGNTFFLANMQGNVSRALTYVRQKCQADFGFNPYIILSGDFFTNDTTCNNAGIADAMQNWFTPPNTSFTLATKNNVKIGVAVSQFHHSGEANYIEPNHGQRFDSGLAGTVGAGALLTLVEGFTDYEEDAAVFRVRNKDANGNALSYTQTGYDYPNQRLNVLRKYSRSPFPAILRFEAEGCDNFGGAAGGNGKVNYYRNGNIAIAQTDDAAGGGHHVGWIQSGEWLEWQSVPFSGSPHLLVRIANPNANMRAHVEIDGVAQASKTLPNTGGWGTWTTFDFGSLGSYANSYHRVRIVFETGNVNFNWWEISTSGAGPVANGTYKVLARHSGKALDVQAQGTADGSNVQQWSDSGGANQRWTLTHLGGGQYSIIGLQSGKALEVAGQSTADGANVQIWSYNGGNNQKWTLTPTSGGYYSVLAVHSGKALDVTGQSTADGANVQQWSSSGGNNQQWIFQAP
jgi:hypothetical protein